MTSVEETIEEIRLFLLPVVEAIRTDRSFEANWKCQDQEWKE